jgi:hypothetical protein
MEKKWKNKGNHGRIYRLTIGPNLDKRNPYDPGCHGFHFNPACLSAFFLFLSNR